MPILFLFVMVVAGYYFWRTQDLTRHPEKVGQQEIAALQAEVSRLIVLPDEQPTLATVSDATTLKASQPFFAQAENGDKVLIYSVAKKAILYRPSLHKIIEVGPVELGASPTPQATVTTTPRYPN